MKKKNKRLLHTLLSCALGFSAICLAVGCGASSENSTSSTGQDAVEKSEYLISGFNTMDDLYAIKPIGVLPTDAFVMDINAQADYLLEGKGSLKYENVQGAYHEAFLLFENTAAADMNAQKISTVSVDVYNPNTGEVNFALLMKTYDGSTLFAQQASIAAGQWTTVSIDLTEYSYAQKDYIKGVSLRFDVDRPSTFYVDNIVAKMGAEDLPPVDLNEMISSLSAPENVEKITEQNVDNHVAFVEKVFYAKRLYDEGAANGVSAENVAKLNAYLGLVEDFGVLYDARTDFISRGYYGNSLTVLAAEDAKYGGVWSINVPKTGEQGVKHNAIQVDGYGKVIYWLYNPTDVDLQANFHGGWNSWGLKKATLLAKSWTKIELNARYFEYDFKGQVFFVISGADKIEGEFKMTSFFGVSAELVAQDVIDKIAALPALDSLTQDDKNAVLAAKAAYDDLSSSAKSAVENLDKLNDCEEKIYALEAEPVIWMIDELPALADLTSQHKDAVLAAKAAYDSLSDKAKAKLSAQQAQKIKDLAEKMSTVFISDAIKALPEADAVSIPKDITTIESLKAEYDALSQTDKAKISADLTEKLQACVTAIQDFTTLFDARTERLYANTNTGANSTTTSAQTDETYGNVFRLDVVAASHGQADFFPKVSFNGYERVFFYIYNPGVEGANLVWYTSNWKNEQGNWTSLAANAWTKIEVGAYYSENNAFYLIDKLVGGARYDGWLITSFYGANGEAVVPDVENPDEPTGNVLLNASNADLLLSGRDTGNRGVVGTAVDETHGDVWTINIASGNQGDFHAKSLNIKDYKYVTFYIYNPANVDVILVCYQVNWSHVSNTIMKAQSWTAVTIDTSKSGADFFFILNTNATDGEWKVTSFIGAQDITE